MADDTSLRATEVALTGVTVIAFIALATARIACRRRRAAAATATDPFHTPTSMDSAVDDAMGTMQAAATAIQMRPP